MRESLWGFLFFNPIKLHTYYNLNQNNIIMKRYLLAVLIIGLCTTTISSIITTNLYRAYVEAAEALLEEAEMISEDNGIPWGDTICEGDTWCNYIDAKAGINRK